MNAINGQIRLNVPEKVNRSTPNGPDISRSLTSDKRNTRDLQEHLYKFLELFA
jgi:hypothetical protein